MTTAHTRKQRIQRGALAGAIAALLSIASIGAVAETAAADAPLPAGSNFLVAGWNDFQGELPGWHESYFLCPAGLKVAELHTPSPHSGWVSVSRGETRRTPLQHGVRLTNRWPRAKPYHISLRCG